MNGSLLGRGRGGRLAVYAGCVVVVVLLVFAYRAAVSEISRLRDLYDQCSSHQESLQQRFQMIFDYKVRLEKSLADETSANAAVKQELQQRANREKSRRDKDSVEAMQRYNSLQQDYKTLQTVHQDLQDECDKRQKVALDNTTRLENMVQGLKLEVKQAKDDKIQSLEHLKNKYLEMDIDKAKIEEKYNEFVKNNEELSIDNQRLQKEVFQLNRELDEAKRSCGAHPAAAPSMSSPSVLISSKLQSKNSGDVEDAQQGAGGPRPPSDQQVSPASNGAGEQPQPLQAPRDHRPIRSNVNNKNDDNMLPNELETDVEFEQKGGGIVVPVGRDRAHITKQSDIEKVKEKVIEKEKEREINLNVLPIPYDFKQKQSNDKLSENNNNNNNHLNSFTKDNDNTSNKIPSENVGDIPQNLDAPQQKKSNSFDNNSENKNNNNNVNNNNNNNNEINNSNVLAAPYPAQKSSSVSPGLEIKGSEIMKNIPILKLQDEMQVLQDKLEGLDNIQTN